MEKQLSTIGYWLGLICTVLALIFRIFGDPSYPVYYCASRMPAPPLRTRLFQLPLERVWASRVPAQTSRGLAEARQCVVRHLAQAGTQLLEFITGFERDGHRRSPGRGWEEKAIVHLPRMTTC
jgi:hypothetical protein